MLAWLAHRYVINSCFDGFLANFAIVQLARLNRVSRSARRAAIDSILLGQIPSREIHGHNDAVLGYILDVHDRSVGPRILRLLNRGNLGCGVPHSVQFKLIRNSCAQFPRTTCLKTLPWTL